jgi:acyl-CoA hydrolase
MEFSTLFVFTEEVEYVTICLGKNTTGISYRFGGGSVKKTKKISDSYTEQVYLIRLSQINGYGRLFGGQLMQWIDETAGVVARRHCEGIVTTACIDTLNFKGPAYQNDMLVLVGRITYTGRSSMEIRIDTYVESLDGIRRSINRAYVVMVAIDENGAPVTVPEIEYDALSVSEKAEWENGKKRYELRKKRKQEGF